MYNSENQTIVDLTNDHDLQAKEPVQLKKRSLPASVLPPSYTPKTASGISNRIVIPSTTQLPTTHRVLPISIQSQGQQSQAYSRPNTQYAVPNARIEFSIVNSRQFTARAEAGTVVPAVIQTFSKIPGAKFDWPTCKWLFPLHAHDNLQVALASHRHTVVPLPRLTLAAAQLKSQREEQEALSGGKWDPEESLLALKGHIPDAVLHQLAPFQRDAVKFIVSNKGRALVADEMGLGKTRTAISAAMAYQDDWPLLVVSPSSARHHWQAEILSVLYPHSIEPKDITIVESNAHPVFKGADHFKQKVLICSYHLVSRISAILERIQFNVVIVDESHYMKSMAAQRTRCLVPLLHRARRAILLSGTPALSRPIELFTQLHALSPSAWPDMKEYGRRYCTASKAELRARKLAQQQLLQQQQRGLPIQSNSHYDNSFHTTNTTSVNKSWSDFSGASNVEELHVMLTATLMIRRLKKDILAQLPSKTRQIIRVPIENKAKSDELFELLNLASKYEEEVKKQKKSKSVGEEKQRELNELNDLRVRKKTVLMSLFTKSGEAKLPAILKHLEVFLDDKLAGKVLVFCHHRTVMEGLAHMLTQRGEEYIRIDGQTPSKERHSRVQRFQTSSQCRVAILAITAAGIALTLTAASTVYFAELFWTPAALLQAEDRAHRIGQVNTVKVTYFLAKNSVDVLLWPMVRQKMKLLGEIVEGSKDGDFTADLLATGPDAESSEDTAESGAPTSADADGSSNITGLKRSKLEGGSGVKMEQQQDVGDLATEIASEIRRKEREERSKTGRSKGSAPSDSSDEDEEETGEGEDSAAVVEIEEPDQLALLYMSMAKEMNKLRGSGGGSSLAQPLHLQDSEPDVVKSLAKHSETNAAAISLLSPAATGRGGEPMQNMVGREKIDQSLLGVGYTGSLGSGEVEVIDLFAEEEGEKAGETSTDGWKSSAVFSVKDQYTAATADEEDTEHGASSYLVGEEAASAASSHSNINTATSSNTTEIVINNPSLLPATTTASSVVLNETEFFPEEDVNIASKEVLAAKAQKAWNSSSFLPAQRNTKPVRKFTPSLKRPERNDSTSSLASKIAISSITTTITEKEDSVIEKL